MAAMLTAIKLISQERAFLQKKVLFCFQPGEEGKRGASKLLQQLPSLKEAVNRCYALHFHNGMYPGSVKIDSGSVTALSNKFSITIQGRAAHCLAPNEGVDANYIGCSLVSQLYALNGQTVPPLEGSSLVIYKVEGGTGAVMVSDAFRIEGSVRTFSLDAYEKLKERITNLSNAISLSFGAKAELNFN